MIGAMIDGMLGKVKTQHRHDAFEIVAFEHAHRTEHAGRGLQREARVGRAYVSQQARAVRKRGAANFFVRLNVVRHGAFIADYCAVDTAGRAEYRLRLPACYFASPNQAPNGGSETI